MNGLTIREIAERIGISPDAVKIRLIRRGIQPKDHAGKTNIYDESVVELVKAQKIGRPKKNP
jgi:hypothetical protein